MAATSANISRDMFDERREYISNIVQLDIPVVDADFNDYIDSVRNQIRRVQQLLGDGARGNGFKIEGYGAVNDFRIKGGDETAEGAGRIFVAGYGCLIDRDCLYIGIPSEEIAGEAQRSLFPIITSISYDGLSNRTTVTDSSANYVVNELVGRQLQVDLFSVGPFPTILSNTATEIVVDGDYSSNEGKKYRVLLSTPLANRSDYVYLNVFLDEVDATEDPNLLHDYGTPFEAARRWKLRHFLHVREGDPTPLGNYIDLDGLRHFSLLLATIDRTSGKAEIDVGDITDNRPIISTGVAQCMYRFTLDVTLNGQTSFTLPVTPVNPSEVFLSFQGSTQEYGMSKDYYVVGSILTWTNRHFTLASGEILEVWFIQ